MNHYIKRTTTNNPDFAMLIKLLDNELWNELREDQATYDQFNFVPNINTAVLVYLNNEVVTCGCYKQFNNDTVEIKRMFVKKEFRGRGLSKLVLQELETWASENGFKNAVLETSIHFATAIKLYETNGYKVVPNYPPYKDLPESVCFQKAFN